MLWWPLLALQALLYCFADAREYNEKTVIRFWAFVSGITYLGTNGKYAMKSNGFVILLVAAESVVIQSPKDRERGEI